MNWLICFHNLLSCLLACYFLCLAFQFAWLLACLSSPYLLSQPLDFRQRNLLQNRCDRSKACCCSHPRFATNDVFFSPTLEVFHKRITSTGAWTPPWNSLERWDTMAFFCRHRIGCPWVGILQSGWVPPWEPPRKGGSLSFHASRRCYKKPLWRKYTKLTFCHRSGCNKTHQQLPPTGWEIWTFATSVVPTYLGPWHRSVM